MFIKNFKVRLKVNQWIRAWVAIAEHVVVISTFTILMPSWEFNLIRKQLKKDADMRQYVRGE